MTFLCFCLCTKTFPFQKQVSQITVRPSETQMYDLLQCTQEWTIPYSQIYVEGEICCAKNSKAKSVHSHSQRIKYSSVVTPQTSLLESVPLAQHFKERKKVQVTG